MPSILAADPQDRAPVILGAMRSEKTARRRWFWSGTALITALLVGLGIVGWQQAHRDEGSPLAGIWPASRPTFPATDPGLSPTRVRILNVLRGEYEHTRPTEEYTQGVKEAWCADFVSWTQRRAGVTLRNPNTGSWRIPGVATLTEYYQSVGRFHGPDYRPKPGDVVLYSPPNRFKQHTNTVIAVNGDHVTTLGGNEPPNGISINGYDLSTVKGIVGYGSPR